MKTFSESLRFTNHIKNLQNCLALMEQAGVSPKKFVEWYFSNGVHYQQRNELQEAAQKWLQHQLHFVQKNINPNDVFSELFGFGQNNIQKASSELQSALSDFSARFQRSSTLQQQINNPRFNDTIMGLINSLKIFGSRVGGDAGPEDDEVFDHTIRNNPYLPESVSSKAKIKNEIRQTLKDITRFGMSPEIVYEFYIANLQGKELNEGLWDYARQLGSGVMSWMGGKGFHTGWQEKGTQIDQENARKSIDNVLAKIDAMEKTLQFSGSEPHQDFAKYAQVIKTTLTNLKQQQQQAPAEQPGGEQPAGEIAPENISETELANIWEKVRQGQQPTYNNKNIVLKDTSPEAKKFIDENKANVWGNLSSDQHALFRQYVTGVMAPKGQPDEMTDEQWREMFAKANNFYFSGTSKEKPIVADEEKIEKFFIVYAFKTWEELSPEEQAEFKSYVTGVKTPKPSGEEQAVIPKNIDAETLSQIWDSFRRGRKPQVDGKNIVLKDSTTDESKNFIATYKDNGWNNLNDQQKAQFKKLVTGFAPESPAPTETSWTKYDDDEAFMESIYGAYSKKTSWMFHE
jgi:hypothetical protein